MGLFDGTALESPVICDRCHEDIRTCNCPPLDKPTTKQTLKIRLDRRKRGKLITVVSGFQCSDLQILETLASLKSQCGAGGSIEDGCIELQGDHMQRVLGLLLARGYRIRE